MRIKRCLAIILSFVITVSMLTACSGTSEGQTETISEDGVTDELCSDHDHENAPVTEDTVSSESDESEADEIVDASTSDETPPDTMEVIMPDGSIHTHAYTSKVVKATCTENGYTLHTCGCGDSYRSDVVKSTGHNFGDWKTTVAATATTTGEAERICEHCGDKDTKTLGKLQAGHTHSYTKTVVEPTCEKVDWYWSTSEGYTIYRCSCGDSYKADIVEPHTFVVSEVVEATCAREGRTEYTCTLCEYSYYDNWVEALGHDPVFNAERTQEEINKFGATGECCRYYNCRRCSVEILKTQPHTLTVTSRVEETCAFDGKIIYECTTCGGTKEEVLKATGNHTWIRKTMGYFYGYNHNDATMMTCDVCGKYDYDTAEMVYTPYEAAEIMLGYVNELRYEEFGTHDYDLVLSEELMEMAEEKAAEMPVLWDTANALNSDEDAMCGSCSVAGIYEKLKFYSDSIDFKFFDKDYKYFGFYMYMDTTHYQCLTYSVFEYGYN